MRGESEKELWLRVFMAAIQAGMNDVVARNAADTAILRMAEFDHTLPSNVQATEGHPKTFNLRRRAVQRS